LTLAGYRAALNPLLPGLFAWWIAIAGPAFGGPAPIVSRVCAGLALSACVAGPLVAAKKAQLGRALGILGFICLCSSAWLTAPSGLFSRRLDPVLGFVALGAFALFGVGWGAFELESIVSGATERTDAEASDPMAAPSSPLPGPALPFRLHISRALVFFALAVVAAFALLSASTLAAERERGILAEAAAGAAALGLIAAGAMVAERPSAAPSAQKDQERTRVRPRIPLSALACWVLGLAAVVLLAIFAR
jgi:hypothetical protein